MDKLEKFIINQTLKNFFLLLFILLPLNILFIMYSFYNTNYDISLLRHFISIELVKNFLYFLPALLISCLFYTLNVCFPDKALKQYKSDTIIYPFLKYSLLFVFFIILLISFLDTTVIYQIENFQLKQKDIKLKQNHLKKIQQLNDLVHYHIEKKEYLKALEDLEEILILIPQYPPAQDKIKNVKQLIIQENRDRLKLLKEEGLTFFNKKDFEKALDAFKKYLALKENDREVVKLANICEQQINIHLRLITKDFYSYPIILNKNTSSLINENRQINELMFLGISQFNNKKYEEAKKIFKKILVLDINNFDAYYYSTRAQTKLNEIYYFTNYEGKLVKTNLSYLITPYRIRIKKLAKAHNNQYLFYQTTFFNRNTQQNFTKKYGYYNPEIKKFVFVNSFIHDEEKPFLTDNINPDILWYFKDVIKNPEEYSFYKILSFRNYFKNNLKNINLFNQILMIKINYYIFLLFLFFNFLILSYYSRKRTGIVKTTLWDLILLPILFYFIYHVMNKGFMLLKTLIVRSFLIPQISILFNILFYIMLFLIFFLLFQLLKKNNQIIFFEE